MEYSDAAVRHAKRARITSTLKKLPQLTTTRALLVFHHSPGLENLSSLATVTHRLLKLFNWSELTSVAATIRIGFMTSCHLQLHPFLSLIDARITWNGRHARTNTFRLSSFDNSLRSCSLDEESLWQLLALLELEPGGEQVSVR